ncbi:MAG: hypothetical protein U9O53_00520 [archaeon]|nr:hypothetical protein [archaeon]
MRFTEKIRKGSLPIETVVIVVLFIAVLAVLIIIISTITGKGTDDMGQSVDATGSGTLCQIECVKCCGGEVHEDCHTYVKDILKLGDCCVDDDIGNFGC